jgi:hypothetical protein
LYNFPIMPKSLGIAFVFVAFSLGGPCVAEQQKSSAHAAQHVSRQYKEPIPPTPPPLETRQPAPCTETKPCYTKNASPENLPPQWRRPEWVIVYVTIGYAIIAGLTLWAIKRQADTMETQAADAKKSGADALAAIKEQNDNLLISAKAATVMAMASDKSAKAALAQIEMMKDKERARVEIKTFGLELQRVGEEFWQIKTTIELRNVGVGRAYIRLGNGALEVLADGIPEPYSKSLDIVDGFIDPTSPATESFYFFQPDDAALSDCSQKIWSGEWQPRIAGFIEYETVGTRFHRNFSYVWIGNGSPLNIGGMFRSAEENFAPEADEDKVSYGYWLPNSIWLTGWSGDNEEYEMKPQKKKKSPKKAN